MVDSSAMKTYAMGPQIGDYVYHDMRRYKLWKIIEKRWSNKDHVIYITQEDKQGFQSSLNDYDFTPTGHWRISRRP